MTNENAINILRHLSLPHTRKTAFDAFRQAIIMAIEALKEPQIIRCKDCEHYKYGMCMKICANKSTNGFCDWGREENGMNRELKPCRVCGDKNSHAVFNGVAHIDGNRKIVYGVKCDNCGYVKLSFISEKDAINEWNKEVME